MSKPDIRIEDCDPIEVESVCDVGMEQCDDADELERRWNTRNGIQCHVEPKGGEA